MAVILLVDDNEENVTMLGRRLRRAGYEVLEAVNGDEGIRMAQQKRPDLILMDMSMPVLDGWEATRRLKADPDTKDIPVVGLSAHAMKGDDARALGVGCDVYCTKPVEWQRLKEKIAQFIHEENTSSVSGSAGPIG